MMVNEIHRDDFKKIKVFEHLNETSCRILAQKLRPSYFKAGDMVYQVDEISDTMFFVFSGRIKVFRMSTHGKEQLVRIIEAGEFTGELATFNGGIRQAYALASADTYCGAIGRADFEPVLLACPSLALSILEIVAKRLSKQEDQMNLVANENVTDRILTYLISQAHQYGSNGQVVSRLEFSRKDLASYLGTTPETISRIISKLISQNVIDQVDNQTFIVHRLT